VQGLLRYKATLNHLFYFLTISLNNNTRGTTTMNTTKILGLAGIVALAGCEAEPKEFTQEKATVIQGAYVAPVGCDSLIPLGYHNEHGNSGDNVNSYQASIACPDSAGNFMLYRLNTASEEPTWHGVQVIPPRNAR
jgi:hypothetical protein